MSVANLDLNFLPEDNVRRVEGYDYTGTVCTDKRILVSPVAVRHLPISLPEHLLFTRFEYASYYSLNDLPSFELHPLHTPPDGPSPYPDRRQEWKKFLTFLFQRKKVVLIPIDGWELIIKPPNAPPDERTSVRVCYRKLTTNRGVQQTTPVVRQIPLSHGQEILRPRPEVLDPPLRSTGPRVNSDGHVQVEHRKPVAPVAGTLPADQTPSLQPRLGLMHPSYLQTLAQTHASWLFGGLAELIDNARDAHATRLNINITMMKMKGKQDIFPMLRVEDNGKGMTHTEIVRMLSFGHSTPDNDENHIGHFGVGFKTGSMRIGKDVVVLTQSENSRSIGLLSTSYNADKQVLEVPIVTYRKVHGIMELDLTVNSEVDGQACLQAVKNHSPFSEFEIGSLFEKIGNGDSKNGTHIFIYNLDKWGSEYALQWDAEDTSKECKLWQRDITIRSRRVRTRPGQTSREIPLDYSLQSYLEVLFLEPRMIITVQGARVKTTRLAASLNTTARVKGKVAGKQIKLTLGRSPLEYKRGNCGIFLYWHGRLIEAYRRVGGMVHSADVGRGVIGVIDVTPLMENRDGRIGVLNTKQGFEDSEEYALLEKWLGEEFNKYWYMHFDNLEVIDMNVNDGAQVDGAHFEPDREWVQCEKCQKWRKLPRGVHIQDLPEEWFCYMEPFLKTCKEPEEKVDDDIVTVGVNRTSVPTTPSNKEMISSPKQSRLRVVGLNEQTFDDTSEEELQVVVPRRHLIRNAKSPAASSQSSAPETTQVKADGKRWANELQVPNKRRLRRRH